MYSSEYGFVFFYHFSFNLGENFINIFDFQIIDLLLYEL